MLEGRKSGGGCEQFPASARPRHQHLQSAHFCALQNLLQVTGGIPAFCSLSFSFLTWMWLDSEIREPRFSSQSGGCQQVEVGRNLSLALIWDVHSQGWGISVWQYCTKAQQQFWQSESLPLVLGSSGHLFFLLNLSASQASQRLLIFFPHSLLSQALPRQMI